jgi:hypothetical protein
MGFTRILVDFTTNMPPPPPWKSLQIGKNQFRFGLLTRGYMFSTMGNTTMKSEFYTSGWNMLKRKTLGFIGFNRVEVEFATPG